MKFAGYIRIALAVILFTADIVILICGWNHLFRKETVTCSFDSEQVEADTDYNKYRISFISDCSKVQSIDVYYEGRLTPETLAVQSILYDGSRKYTEIREVVIKSDSHIAIELNTERIVMADGTSKYDLCFEKEDDVHLKEITAKVCTKSYVEIGIWMILWSGTLYSVLLSRKKERRTLCTTQLCLMLSVSVAAIGFFCVELLGNELLAEMTLKDTVANIALLTMLGLLMSVMFNSVRNGLIFFLVLYGGLGIVNHYLIIFRSQPLQPSDFFTIRTAAAVVGNYNYSIDRHVVYTVSAIAAYLVILLCLGRLELFRTVPGIIIAKCGAVLIVILFFVLTYRIGRNPMIPEPSYWNSMETYTASGFLPSFISYGRTLMPPSIGYSDERTKAVMSDISAKKGRCSDAEKPNIIVIMNEAMADYRNLGEFEISDSPYRFWDSLREESISGRLIVPVYAGGTANTEYEFLTGNTLSLFSGNGVPYTMYKERLDYSLADVLGAQGYETVAMHPNAPANYNRNKVYPAMGFETFLSEENYFTDAHRLRGLVSDYGDYSAMLNWINNRTDERPYFIFNVTMQNHSDYITNTIPIDTYVEGCDYKDVNEYMTLLKRSDEALEYLVDSLRKHDSKTVVVIFGDHYPALADSFVNTLLENGIAGENEIAKEWRSYEVPLMIWANYDLSEGGQDDLYMSANYLGGYLLNMLGLSLSPYETYLLELQEKFPVISNGGYMTADGQYYRIGRIQSLPEPLYEYYLMQYEQIFKKRQRKFFTG